MLGGCNSAANVTPTQATSFAQTANQDGRSVNLGFIDPEIIGKENIDGSANAGTAPCGSPSSRGTFVLSVSVSGNATGPYPGSFTGSATAGVTCNSVGSTSMSGSFQIISKAKTIGGDFSGSGVYSCTWRFGGCSVTARDVTYSASLTRGGKVRKQFSGRTSGGFSYRRNLQSMLVTLHGM